MRRTVGQSLGHSRHGACNLGSHAPPCRAVALVAIAAGPAHALEQKQHRTISRSACLDAGLPYDFCDRVGVEAYNVDAYEWNDLSAHAQIDDGQTACQAANAALDRVQWLGAEVRDDLFDLGRSSSEDVPEHVAVQLGRALHTVQDNCAHRGMPNPQHAWFSLSDTCNGTQQSPDAQPAALTCARTETTKVFAAFVATMDEAGVSADQLEDVDTGWTHWPSRGDVCEFLSSANTWNGRDGTWRNEIVVTELRDQLAHSLAWGDESIGDACAAGPNVLQPLVLAAPVDTSRGLSRCLKIKTYCLGKADDAADEPPPWDDGTTDDAPVEDAGCSAAGASGSGTAILLLVGLVALRRRRR